MKLHYRRELFVMVAIALTLSLALSEHMRLQDLSIYWAATKKFLAGVAPYLLPHHSQYVYGTIGGLDLNPNSLQAWIPPYAFISIFWMGLLSLPQLKFLFCFIMFLSFLGLSRVIVWHALKDQGSCFAPPSFVFAFSLFIFSIYIDLLRYGGVTWSVFSITLALICYFAGKEMYFWTGFVSMLFFFKVQFILLLSCALSVYVWRRKKLTFLLGMGLGVVVMGLGAWLINKPAWFAYDPVTISRFISGYLPITMFLGRPLSGLGLSVQHITAICSVSAIVCGLWWGFRCSTRNISFVQLVFCSLPISMMFSPYGWIHDYAVLFPVYVLFFIAVVHNSSSKEQWCYSVILLVAMICFLLPFSYGQFQPVVLLLHVAISDTLLDYFHRQEGNSEREFFF